MSTPAHELSALEAFSLHVANAPGVTAVSIVTGRRKMVFGTPVGPPQAEWSLSSSLTVGVWGAAGPIIDATLELARLVDLREQEVEDLVEALTQSHDRQLRLYELSRASVDNFDRGTAAKRLLGHARVLAEADVAVLVDESGKWWVETGSDDDPSSTAATAVNGVDTALDVAKGAFTARRFHASGSDAHTSVIANRLDVDGERFVVAVGRPASSPFGTAERKVLDALAGALESALRLGVLHEAALANAIVENEYSTATTLASAVLPKVLPDLTGLDVHAKSIPARSVGGDFYTALRYGGSLRFVVGDVAGKGLPAAVLMTNAITVSNMVFKSNVSANPTDLLVEIAAALEQILEGTNRFITMLVGTVERNSSDPSRFDVSLANAGHSPVLVSIAGTVEAVPPIAPPVGVCLPRSGVPQRFVIGPGDAVIVGSDGLVEQDNSEGELFGQERLQELLGTDGSASELSDRIFEAVRSHAAGQPTADDQTVFLLRPNGKIQ